MEISSAQMFQHVLNIAPVFIFQFCEFPEATALMITNRSIASVSALYEWARNKEISFLKRFQLVAFDHNNLGMFGGRTELGQAIDRLVSDGRGDIFLAAIREVIAESVFNETHLYPHAIVSAMKGIQLLLAYDSPTSIDYCHVSCVI